jgi:hypothetical protein
VDLSGFIGWGWKEPHSYLLIEQLSEYFPNLRYIHVVRHGLDMAYSKNQDDLKLWGELYGVPLPPARELRPKASLNYWIRANEKAITVGQRCLRDRFFLINFDQMCRTPEPVVKALIDFLRLGSSAVSLDELCGLIKTPATAGRYQRQDLSIFSEEEIAAVRKLGFEVKDGKA